MQSKFYLAALATACLVFSWQPVLAQYGDDDDDAPYEQEQTRQYQEHNDCVDAVAANMGDPSAMTRIGFSPKSADVVAKMHDKIVEIFANLVSMQRYIDNLDMIKPVLAGKKDSKARKIIEDIQANVRGQMVQLRLQLDAMSDIMLKWASSRCERNRNTARRKEGPPVSIGIGVETEIGDDDHHHHRRSHGHGSEDHAHPGCIPH